MFGIEGLERLADRALDPEAPVTTCDGDLDASPLFAGFPERRADAGLQARDGATIPSPNGLNEERAEQ
jgi:hypothetical protein